MAILLFFTFIFTSSCSDSKSSNTPTVHLEAIRGDHFESDPIPNEALTFEINIDLVNATLEQEEKILEAIEIIKKVVATEEFRNQILNFSYKGEYAFINNRGYSNAQIYQIILNGAETLSPYRNNQLDAEVEFYHADTNVVGYTYRNTRRIWINTKFFDKYTPAGVAHNLFHEWMHKLGFEHDITWSQDRDASVPYALGFIMGEVGKEFL